MLTKFVNVFDNCKLRIRKHYLVSLSYVLLHLLTLRLFDNPAPGVERGAKIGFNFPVGYSATTLENQAQIITFMNNLYQNYHVLNSFFLSYYFRNNKLYQQIIPFIDCIMST